MTYSRTDLQRFLDRIDAHLSEPAQIIIIGGAAAAMAYGVSRSTRDIDTWSAVDGALARAIDRAQQHARVRIPIEHAAVADAPWHFESRLLPLNAPGWSRLTVFVPEPHDLVLMKCVRGYEHDLETAAEIHRTYGLDLETLLSRFLDEMTHVIGDSVRSDQNFRALVDRLYGEAAEMRVAKALWRRRAETHGPT